MKKTNKKQKKNINKKINTKENKKEKDNIKGKIDIKENAKENKKVIIKELLLPLYIIINIIYINMGCLLAKYNYITLEYFSKGLRNLLIVNGIIIIIRFIYKLIKKEKLKPKLIDIVLLFIIIFSIISVVFAIDKKLALYGTYIRYEGLFSILYYLTLFYISIGIKEKYKKIIIYSMLACGFIQLLYAVIQVWKLNIFNLEIKRVYNDGKLWANGFITNPNFFGTYMLLCIAYSIGLFFDTENEVSITIFFILISNFMIGILISNTLSCLIALIGILIYLLIYTIKNKQWDKYVFLILTLIVASVFVCQNHKTTLFKDFYKTAYETKEITKGKVDDSYGTKRMFIWKSTLKIVPKYIIHGVGLYMIKLIMNIYKY